MKEKTYKVLVIEDDQDQVRVLLASPPENVEITIFSTSREFRKDESNWDFIITDLCLPFKSGSQPKPSVGYKIFQKIIEKYTTGEIRGAGLISNYEHHRDDRDSEEQQSLHYGHEDKLKRIASEISSAWKCFFRSPEKKNALNIQVVLDRSIGMAEEWIVDGKQKTVDIQDACYLFKSGKGKMVKPYKEVIEKLIENQ